MSNGLEKLTILLVDDYEHMGHIVRPMLASVGVGKVVFVNTGPQAMEALRKETIDIAILDFNIGDRSGSDLTRTIRCSPHSPNPYLPIIMLTAHSELRRIVEARDAGVNEFCRKPVTATELLSKIGAVITRPRPFVRTADYFGPDRRRRRSPHYSGPERRQDQAGKPFVEIP